MSSYDTEQEQLEAIKRWWKDNGTALTVGLAIGLAALFGWRYWNDQRTARAEQASITYELLVSALQKGQVQEAIDIGERVMAEYQDSSYAVLSALLLGRLAVDRQNLADARAKLQWARDHADSPGLKQVAATRIAAVLLHEGQADEAWQELERSGAAAVDGFHEIKGDILAARGDLAGARQMYQRAIERAVEDGTDARFIEYKLDNLAAADQDTDE